MGTYTDTNAATGPADVAGFRAFYEREFEVQIRRAGLVLDSSAAAFDVVQDAFIAVWQRWDDLRDPHPYLTRCVMNGCRSVARHQRVREQAIERLQPLAHGEQPTELLSDALAALDFRERAPLVLRYYGRLGNREIAAALGWPEGSVGPRISKGLRTLRKAIR